MRLAEELSKIVVGIIESAGYLKPTFRSDPRVMADIETAIAGRIQGNRQQLLNFLSWLAQEGHREHERVTLVRDWRKCQNNFCLSLYGSAIELEDELKFPVEARHPHPAVS